MKKRSLFFCFLFFPAILHAADVTKKVFNPFTGTFDFINNLASTSAGALLDISTAGATNGNTYCWAFDGTKFSPTGCPGTSGGTTIWVKKDNSAFDNAVSTINFWSSGLTLADSPAGQVNFSLSPGTTLYIQNATLLQQASFYVLTGTTTGNFFVNGVIVASKTQITTAAGLLDATQLTNNVPQASLGNGQVNTNASLKGGGALSSTLTLGIDCSSGTCLGQSPPASSIAAGSLGSSVLASSFPVSGVTSGSYTNTNLTVNAQGIITTASNGTSSGGGYAVEPATVPFKLNQGFSTAGATFTALSPGVMHIVAVSSVVATGLVSMSTETSGPFISSVNVSAALTVTANGLNNIAITVSANTSSTTLQGNAFNGASQLIQATAATKYPAIDGSLITNIPQLASTQTWTGGNTWTSSSTWTSTMSATGMSSFVFGQTSLVDSTNNIFQVGTSTTFAYTKTGHFEFHATTTPTVSSCGTGASVASGSSDVTGTLTMGSVTVGCTLTFSQAWKNVPQCFGNDETGINAVRFVPTVNNVVITTAGAGGDTVDWMCVGEQ